MRVLLIVPHPLIPPDRGNKHHTLNLLRYAAVEHDIDVIGFDEAGNVDSASSWHSLEAELPRVRVLRTFKQAIGWRLQWERLQTLLELRPRALARYRCVDLVRFFRSLAEDAYDVVCFDMFMLAEYQRLLDHSASVLLATDAYSLMIARYSQIIKGPIRNVRNWFDKALQQRFERRAYPRFDVVACVSPLDAQWLRQLQPLADIQVLGIPVEEAVVRAAPRNYGTEPRHRVVCWASVSHDGVATGVRDFIVESWPKILSAVPDAELIVWGRNPHRRMAEALRQPGVRHLDYVRDWISTLRESTVFVYPQRCGSGLQTKVQSAMALGIPTVLSPEAAGGLSIRHGENAFVCRTSDDFAERCSRLLTDDDLQVRIGTAGRTDIMTIYSPQAIGSQMFAMFERAITKRRDRNHAA